MTRLRTVAIVGVDGSGKSTQVTLLHQELGRADADVIVIHPFGWQLLPVRETLDSGVVQQSSSSRTVLRQAAAVAELVDNGLYLWFTYLRSWATAFRRRRTTWLLSDRSPADLLIKHRHRRTLPQFVIALWHRVVPRAGITVWLQTDPPVAARRDAEFPLHYYEDLHQHYAWAAQRYGWNIVHTSGYSIDEVHQQVLRIIGEA